MLTENWTSKVLRISLALSNLPAMVSLMPLLLLWDHRAVVCLISDVQFCNSCETPYSISNITLLHNHKLILLSCIILLFYEPLFTCADDGRMHCWKRVWYYFLSMDLFQSPMYWSPTKLASCFINFSIYFVLKALLAIEMKPFEIYSTPSNYSGTNHSETTLLILLFYENLMDKSYGYLYILHSVVPFLCNIFLFYCL